MQTVQIPTAACILKINSVKKLATVQAEKEKAVVNSREIRNWWSEHPTKDSGGGNANDGIKQNKIRFRRRSKEEALRTNNAAFRTGWAKVV